MNSISHKNPHVFCLALVLAGATGCITEPGPSVLGAPDELSKPSDTVETVDKGAVSDFIEPFGPTMVAAPMERELATLELSEAELDTLAAKIASITPSHFGDRFDYATFLDLDLGGLMTTDVQNLNACRTTSYDAESSRLNVQYNCDDLNTMSAPNGSISCLLSDDYEGPQKRVVKRLACNYNFATTIGEVAGVLRGSYSRHYQRLMATVHTSVYTTDSSFNIDVYAEYAIDQVNDACSAYNGRAVAQRGTHDQTLVAEFTALTRCADSCRASGGDMEFWLSTGQGESPQSHDTLSHVGADAQWEHQDPAGAKTLYTVCD